MLLFLGLKFYFKGINKFFWKLILIAGTIELESIWNDYFLFYEINLRKEIIELIMN